MALLQRTRILSQQRIDLPDYRAIEDFVCADFKAIHKNVWTNQNFVFSGFEATGTGTSDLNIAVAGSSLVVGQNDGVLYIGAPSLSNITTDALTPASTNYVELIVEQDTGGADSRAFWDQTAGGGAGGEFSQIVDTFIFNKVSLRINTSNFTNDPDKVKVCEVDVNGAGIITAIRDRRDLFFRLGRGTQPNFAFSWSSRTEPPTSQFTGADKDIDSLKKWMDAVMDSIREVKGTTYWYEAAGSSIVGSFRNASLSVITALGNNVVFKWSGSALSITDDNVSPASNDTIAAIRLLDSASNILLTRQESGQEVQKVTFSAIPDAGNFTLEHNGNITANIPFSANAAAVLAACNLAFVSQLASVTGDFENGFTLTFLTPANVAAVTVNSNTLTRTLVAVTTSVTTIKNGFTGSSAIALADGEALWVELPDPLANVTISGTGVTATNFRVSPRGSVPNNDNTFWIAFREGTNLYIRNQGELEPGETAEISDNINENILQAIGIPSETSLPNYTSNNVVADGDSLVTAVSKLDGAAGAATIGANQDRSMKLIEGGTFGLDYLGTTLSWSADAFIDVPEVTRVSNRIVAGNVTLPNANSVAYVEINRASGAATLTVNVADIDALVPTPNTVIIARKVSSGVLVGQHCFLLKPSEKLELDGALAEINRLLGQLRITAHETAANKARISAADITLLNSNTLSQIIGDFLLKFDGAVINFTTGAILKADDSTPLGINFTPQTIPAGEYFWYGLSLIPANVIADNTQEAQVQIDLAASSNASASAALKPVISGDIKLGAIQVRNNAGNIELSDIHRLGVGSGSGSGSGDASAVDTALRDRFALNNMLYLTENIFRSDKATKIDPASTGAFSPAKKAFGLTSAGQTLVSVNHLDADFLTSGSDLSEVELYLFWLQGFVDTAATYEVSRDGGVNYQTVTATRVGLSNAFRMYHRFTEEITPTSLVTLAASGAGDALNATTRQQISQTLQITDASVVNSLSLPLNYGGTGVGKVTARIVKNNAGSPSDNVLDILSESDAKTISTASLGGTGNITVTFDMPNVVLPAGTYHIVLSTDAAYKAGTLDLSWRQAASGPSGSVNNGTTWSAGLTRAFTALGRKHDLRVRVTSSAVDKYVEGYGVYYGAIPASQALGQRKIQKFAFSGDENRTDFILNFEIDPEILSVYDPVRGQVYVIENGVLRNEGNTLKFAPGTFDFPGEQIILHARQLEGNGLDVSNANAAAISEHNFNLLDIGEELLSGELDHVTLPKIVAPFSTVQNRALIPDFTQDLSVKLGTERITTHRLILMQNENGPNGEAVNSPLNDKFNRIRFVGPWHTLTDNNGPRVENFINGSGYIEVTFYGTGLNVLTLVNGGGQDMRVSVNGGSEGANIYPSATGVFNNQRYANNTKLNAVKDLAPGLYTVKLRVNNFFTTIHGFEILNQNAANNLIILPGSQYIKGRKKTHTVLEAKPYNSGFESGTLGTKGGRVLIYQKPDGSIASAVTPVDASALTLGSTNHANEEMARQYFVTEFMAGRNDDFSGENAALWTTGSGVSYTLDDNETTLIGSATTRMLGYGYLNPQNNGDHVTFHFVGCGIDLILNQSGATNTSDIYLDGVHLGTGSANVAAGADVIKKVASGLPYGSHTVKIVTVSSVNNLSVKAFKVYRPKTPALPANCAAITAYNINANFVANATMGRETMSTGVIRKSNRREWVPVGSWNITPDTGRVTGYQFYTTANGAYAEFTFIGTGFDFRFANDNGQSPDWTVSVDGNSNLSAYTTSLYANGSVSFTPATGNIAGTFGAFQGGQGLTVSGLTHDVHTVRITRNTGATMYIEALDIITPISSQKDNGPFSLNNTLTVGSESLEDLRKFSKKDVITRKARAQGLAMSASPATSATTAVPMPDMNGTITTKTGIIRVSYSAILTNAGGAFVSTEIIVNSERYGPQKAAIDGTNRQTISDSLEIEVGPGTHTVYIGWYVNGSSVNADDLSRTFSLEEVE